MVLRWIVRRDDSFMICCSTHVSDRSVRLSEAQKPRAADPADMCSDVAYRIRRRRWRTDHCSLSERRVPRDVREEKFEHVLTSGDCEHGGDCGLFEKLKFILGHQEG